LLPAHLADLLFVHRRSGDGCETGSRRESARRLQPRLAPSSRLAEATAGDQEKKWGTRILGLRSLRILLRLPNVAVEKENAKRGFRGFNLGVALTLALKSLQIQRDSSA
jgi:hypothetical protein